MSTWQVAMTRSPLERCLLQHLVKIGKENEPVNIFITNLFTLAQHCNYGNLHNEIIRDRIVIGLKDKSLSKKLQLEAELKLENASNQARQRELVKQQ